MELLNESKGAYLLNVSAEALHEENTEWMEDIAFWKDEAAFLSVLLDRKKEKALAKKQTYEELVLVQEDLINFDAQMLNNIRNEVARHEKKLESIIDNNEKNFSAFIEEHVLLKRKIKSCEKWMRERKNKIFRFAEYLGWHITPTAFG